MNEITDISCCYLELFRCGWMSGSLSKIQVLHNPRHEVGDARVHAWIVALSATDTPGYDTNLSPPSFIHHQRATGVTLRQRRLCHNSSISHEATYAAGIFGILSGTQHRIDDSAWSSSTVLVATQFITPNWHRDLLQNGWLGSV